MSNNSKEILYKKYKLKGLLNSKKKYLEEHPDAKINGTLAETFKKRFDILDEDYDKYVEKYSDIQKIKSKFTEKRAEGFESIIAFYDWYTNQPQSCGYCGISQDELQQLFGKNKKLPLNGKKKRSSGTLEIERRDSREKHDEYNEKNCILACPLCNNAKSNLIDEDNWMSLFVEPMREYYRKLLGKDLGNPKPEKLSS